MTGVPDFSIWQKRGWGPGPLNPGGAEGHDPRQLDLSSNGSESWVSDAWVPGNLPPSLLRPRDFGFQAAGSEGRKGGGAKGGAADLRQGLGEEPSGHRGGRAGLLRRRRRRRRLRVSPLLPPPPAPAPAPGRSWGAAPARGGGGKCRGMRISCQRVRVLQRSLAAPGEGHVARERGVPKHLGVPQPRPPIPRAWGSFTYSMALEDLRLRDLSRSRASFLPPAAPWDPGIS